MPTLKTQNGMSLMPLIGLTQKKDMISGNVYKISGYVNIIKSSRNVFIRGAFDWRRTKEGFGVWSDLSQEWEAEKTKLMREYHKKNGKA